ncbi:antiviral reverse transcriptase Drt3a [Aeromonas piscicola]|uniref:antiviral reverse transcriptase Drt3a n=1 Tax=Aeromonas piscicola TaxID=600645 RepID=UPI0009E445A1|nr:antiviral reverse transcriptase Drt3a [Aeromonas piscicola]
MLNQTFEYKTLLRLTRKQEIIKFSLGRENAQYEESLKLIAKNINAPSFSFSSLSFILYNGKTVFTVTRSEEYYAIKKIAHDLKILYRVRFSGRDEITEQITSIFHDTSSFSTIKIDISSFFESINFKDLIVRLKNDNILSYKSIKILEDLSHSTAQVHTGLPRGLGISSILSEIYMEDIDLGIKKTDGTYYYARYVDDIIIITHSKTISLDTYKNLIDKNGLSSNKKSTSFTIPTIDDGHHNKCSSRLEFLGYEYNISNTKNTLGMRNVHIYLSRKKINKIKSRIIQAIQDFKLSGDIATLELRLQFLSSNYPIDTSTSRRHYFSDDEIDELRGGIFYNNKYVNTPERLLELNDFLTRLMFSKKTNSIGRTIQSIPIQKRRRLASMDFKNGFIKKHYHNFDKSELNLICSCWN